MFSSRTNLRDQLFRWLQGPSPFYERSYDTSTRVDYWVQTELSFNRGIYVKHCLPMRWGSTGVNSRTVFSSWAPSSLKIAFATTKLATGCKTSFFSNPKMWFDHKILKVEVGENSRKVSIRWDAVTSQKRSSMYLSCTGDEAIPVSETAKLSWLNANSCILHTYHYVQPDVSDPLKSLSGPTAKHVVLISRVSIPKVSEYSLLERWCNSHL